MTRYIRLVPRVWINTSRRAAAFFKENHMVKMTEVKNSSAIDGFHYDGVQRQLSIHFKNANKTHHYHDVSPEQAKAFEAAESKGKYHAAHIKGKYHHTTVDA